MCCDIHSRPRFSMPVPTCASSSCCSVIAISRLRPAICMSPRPDCTPRRVRSTTSPFASSEMPREGKELHDRTSARSGRCLSRAPEPVPSALGARPLGPAAGGVARYRPMATVCAAHPCRNRPSPKCQSSPRDPWLMKQAASLLPVPYAHVVFTVPEQLAPLAFRNQRLFYNLLFRAASETLLKIAADPRHLGARIGALAVLHTWSQNLRLHPHLHCLVPTGGLALDHSRWVGTRRGGFFLPVRVLSRMFRGKLLAFLKRSYRRNQLYFAGKLAELSAPRAFYSLLASLRRREWVVYSKPPFGGPEHVLKYLARYTHRVAISNGRLLGLENGQVSFRWRDSRHNNRSSVMRLNATEFIRRFLLHFLPAGFVKIRHFGLLANRNRRQALSLCRTHLQSTTTDLTTLLTEKQRSALDRSCPQCRCGTLRVIAHYFAGQLISTTSLLPSATVDSS